MVTVVELSVGVRLNNRERSVNDSGSRSRVNIGMGSTLLFSKKSGSDLAVATLRTARRTRWRGKRSGIAEAAGENKRYPTGTDVCLGIQT